MKEVDEVLGVSVTLDNVVAEETYRTPETYLVRVAQEQREHACHTCLSIAESNFVKPRGVEPRSQDFQSCAYFSSFSE